MSGAGFFADTTAIGSAGRTLEDAGELLGGALSTFAVGATGPGTARAFGDLDSMAEAAARYEAMTHATVAVLFDLRMVLEHDANRLRSSGQAYELADDTAAASFSATAAGTLPGGPRVVAVDLDEMRAFRDTLNTGIHVLSQHIEYTWAATMGLRWSWRGPAARAFRAAVSRWLTRAVDTLGELIGLHQSIADCLTLYGDADTAAAALWPAIEDPAPPPPAPGDGPPVIGPVNGWETTATEIAHGVLTLFGLPWPGGVPDQLRELAGHWRATAQAVDDAIASVGVSIEQAAGVSWQGTAAEAFAAHVRTQRDHMLQGPAGLRTVAAGLEQYAAEVEEMVGTIVRIAVEIFVMIMLSRIVGAVTGFLSDVVTSGAVATRVARIGLWLARLAERAGRIGRLLRSATAAIGRLKTVLATIRTAARTELAASRLGSAGRSLDAFATRLGGTGYRTLLTEMGKEWRIDFAAMLVQEKVTTGHVDIGRAAINATGTSLGRGGQLRLEGVSSVIRGWRQSRPLLYAGLSRAVLTDLNGAVVDPLSGMSGQETAVDLLIRPLYAAPRAAFLNHPTLGARRSGVGPAQTSAERSTVKMGEKIARSWTERQISATTGYDTGSESVVATVPD